MKKLVLRKPSAWRVALLACVLAGCSGGADGPPAAQCSDDTRCTDAAAAGKPAGGRTTDGGATQGDDDAGDDDGGANPSGPGLDAGATVTRNPDGGKATGDASTTPPKEGGAAAPAGSKPSAGCGTTPPAAGNRSINVSGTSRDYIVTLPKNYDKTRAYKLVFAWHGQGGTAAEVARDYYGLLSQAGDGTIFVAGQGLQTSNSVGTGAGWPNTNGQDVAFVKAMVALFESQLCVDENRVFSVGMSYGGIMSDTLGCQMGDVFRAIAPMSGEGPGYGGRAPTCAGEVAVWSSHGDKDTTVPTAGGEASRDFWVKSNHCQSTTKAVTPSPCVAYDGCDPGYPVTWCEFPGGHVIPSFAAKAIWAFFSQF